MKWGRKKISSESSRNSLISHVFPVSWLSKFKQKSRDVEAKPAKVKQEGNRNSPSKCVGVSGRGGRFYGGEGDAFWRLSFGEEGGDQGKTSRGDLSSVWYDHSDDKLDVPPSVCRSCGSNATTLLGNEEIYKFNNLVSDARKMKELQKNVEIFHTQGEAVTKTLRVTTKEERKLKKINERVPKPKEKWSKLERSREEREEKSRKSFEKDNSEFETIPMIKRENCKLIRAALKKHHFVSSTDSRNSNLTTVKEDDVLTFQNLNGNNEISAGKVSSEWETLKEMKLKEVKSKSENQRKSLYISRELQTRKTKQITGKVKVGSPRIKALEDMKKAKLMKMKKGKEKTSEGANLESFAVVKCSFDPQKDFRDSMIEMILEKRFSQPQELEELLACYLTLNSDEYHDLIIKVFRQVWFDLNQACFDELQNANYCHN